MKTWMGPLVGGILLLGLITRPSVLKQWDFSAPDSLPISGATAVSNDSLLLWSQAVAHPLEPAPAVVRDPFIAQSEIQEVPDLVSDAQVTSSVTAVFPAQWKLVGRVNTQTALLQPSPGLVNMVSVGTTIDGWTVQEISPRGVSFCQGKNCHTLLPP